MNKKIIVTGGYRGIGRAITEQLLRDGYDVVVCARNEEELKFCVSELSPLGKIDYTALDIADRDAVKDFTDKWDKEIYALINNAGVFKEERLDEADSGTWDRTMNLNLTGLYFLTKGLLPHIEKPGRIINISSQLGNEGREEMGIYTASKHAVNGLTKCWALELGKERITVNAVCPGWVRTKSNMDDIDRWAKEEGKTVDQKYKELSDPLILGRFIEPEEVASLVSFLTSPKASGITGKIYEIK